MSRSNPPPPSQNPRDNNAPKPPSLSIQEALAKINKERLANLNSTGLPRPTLQPSASSNAPYRFVNPRDVEQVDTTEFWRAGGETEDEQDGEFFRERSRQEQKQKEEAKRAADEKRGKENASAEKDVQGEVDEQVDDENGELQPEPASPKPEKKGENEWKYLKKIAGLPPKRRSAARRDTDSNAG
ncbi:uncharacterized protein RHO25_010749 [Cercospora beticola]|uniref:Uncharacterized protein n=1 Tax=Cercospora beticola TaxID=122368 RepID=A0ABZ0P332_CERBT|nr:hypothetical protein RHO25_010749 [Cercospora beticola]CAK1365974.1 unnamed protein product [Cercospora beticola]